MSERFFIEGELAPGPVELVGPEAHHLAAVCRLRPGDAVCLFNGDGADYPATVVEVAKKRVELMIAERRPVNRELEFSLEIAAAIPTSDRAHFLVEKLTELGVTAFVPLICERSAVHPKPAAIEKMRRGVIEASKQCGRNLLMRVEMPTSWPDYAQPRDDEVRLFAHPTAEATDSNQTAKAIRCVIGPEGGFTANETEIARVNGWQFVDLGRRILRIETAAIAMAIAVVGRSLTSTDQI
jgi:16S rRNA (uracil1498-N3)-methyltransferase